MRRIRSSNQKKRDPDVLLLAILAISLTPACVCDEPLTFLDVDFEGCEEACGLEVDPPVAIEQVATFHPAEHGLRVAGATSLKWWFAEDAAPIDVAEVERIEVLTDCPVGLTARIGDGVGGVADLALARELDLDATFVRVFADTSWVYSVGRIAYLSLAVPAGCTVDRIRMLGAQTCPGA